MTNAIGTLAAGILALAAAMGIGRFVYTPILPVMMAATGMSPADGGLIASANFMGYLAGAILATGGWAQGRERGITLGALGANAVLLFAMAASDDLTVLVVLRFLAGVASAFAFVFASTIVFARLAAAGRAEFQTLMFMGVGFGIAISSVATAGVYSLGADWHAGWIVSGTLAAILLACVAMLLSRAPQGTGTAIREPRLSRSRVLDRLILAYGLFGVGYVVTSTFLIAIARDLGRGPLFESSIWMVAGLSAIPSLWAWNRVASRFGLRRAYALACLVEAIGVGASVLIPGAAGPLIAAVLLGGTFLAVTGLGLVAARLIVPQAPRRVVGIMTASFGVGQILGPIAAGYLTDWTGSYLVASLAAAGFLLASAIVMLSAAQRPGSSGRLPPPATMPPEF